MRKNRKGFTLIEIMLVVVIILVLASMAVTNLVGRGEQARISAAKADIQANLSASLDLYELDNGKYPTTEQGLIALIQKPTTSPVPNNWNGPYLKKKKIPLDPWGREYVFVCPGIHNTDDYVLTSYGPDGVQSNDDITNWTEAEKTSEWFSKRRKFDKKFFLPSKEVYYFPA